jgi:hypothetical protein
LIFKKTHQVFVLILCSELRIVVIYLFIDDQVNQQKSHSDQIKLNEKIYSSIYIFLFPLHPLL